MTVRVMVAPWVRVGVRGRVTQGGARSQIGREGVVVVVCVWVMVDVCTQYVGRLCE